MEGVRFDPKPSQDGEKDKKRRKKEEKKIGGGGGGGPIRGWGGWVARFGVGG